MYLAGKARMFMAYRRSPSEIRAYFPSCSIRMQFMAPPSHTMVIFRVTIAPFLKLDIIF